MSIKNQLKMNATSYLRIIQRATHQRLWRHHKHRTSTVWPQKTVPNLTLMYQDLTNKTLSSNHKKNIPLEKYKHSQKIKTDSMITVKPSKIQSQRLNISCLGRFRVFLGNSEIPAKRWKSKKSKILFKLLIQYRSKGYVNKEVFMEHLWPEGDPQKTAKRFHVTLTTLRKTLEPTVKRGIVSSFILSQGDTYFLDLGEGGSVDIEEFEELYRHIKEEPDRTKVIVHLLKAEALYHGDYLEEDLYEPWCIDIRDHFREKHLSVLASIIDYYDYNKDYQRSIDFCIKYLSLESFSEDIYQQLMRCYASLGNRGMVIKTYTRCKETIVNEMNFPLSKETKLLYEELIYG